MKDNNVNVDTTRTVKIGTRGSDLALWQARTVASMLNAETELVIIKTSGDRFQDIPLQGQADTGFFTKEIESRLLEGDIDLAVHSLKDLPTQSSPGLTLGAYLPRATPNDLLLVHPDWIDENGMLPLREGCAVGATSLRRQALLRLYAPAAVPTMLRGNVPNRVKKCIDGQYGAIVLACAGIQRLGLNVHPLRVYELNIDAWLPAPGQAVVAVQARENDERVLSLLETIDHRESREAITIERQLLANFEGGCHTAFGSFARRVDGKWDTQLGLELEGKGWGQVRFELPDLEAVRGINADSFDDYKPLNLQKQEELCREILL